MIIPPPNRRARCSYFRNLLNKEFVRVGAATVLGLLSLVVFVGAFLPSRSEAQRSRGQEIGEFRKPDLPSIREFVAGKRQTAEKGSRVSIHDLEEAIESLAELGVPDSMRDRSELAQVWKNVAELSRAEEGDSPLFYDAVQTAFALDPENPEIAREANFQKLRRDAFEQRLELAAKERARRTALK